MKILWSSEATRELLAIENWIAAQNPRAARAVARRVRRRVRDLARFPEMGTVAVPPIRQLVVDYHLVFYFVEPNVIRILRVWDSRRPLPETIGEREAEYSASL